MIMDFSLTSFLHNMRRVCARWIPKMLSEDQKKQRIECQAHSNS